MKPHEESQALLNRQASDWVEILRQGREEDSAAFVQWLMESPRHVRDYLLMETLDGELAELKSAPLHELDESPSAAQDVIALRGGTPLFFQRPAIRRTHLRLHIGTAAGLALIALTSWLLWSGASGWTDFRTALGEQRSVELQDGSLLHMNTLSHVRVRLNARSREVKLLEGEAIFKVHPETARPFRVHTEDATIEALGTQFEVYRRQENTLVAVLEGRVRVRAGTVHEGAPAESVSRSANLAAGEGVRIHRNGQMDGRGLPSVVDSVAWRQRRLVFHETALEHIAAEFNRYNHAPQLRIVGKSLRKRQYSGVFDADDPQSLMELLSQYADLTLERTGSEIVVEMRSDDSP